MSVTLTVDGHRWRAHQDRVAATAEGVVPVAKGNGYGFGLPLLFDECARLYRERDVTTMAVGTYVEAPLALQHFPGDVLVMEPYRPRIHAALPVVREARLVHTVTSRAHLEQLHETSPQARFVLEALTSMLRHGMTRIALRGLVDARQDDRFLGVTMHLPLGTGHMAEVETWLGSIPVDRWFLSHLAPEELRTLSEKYPGRSLRPRIGTRLWLGDEGAFRVRAHVLDVHPVDRGDRVGYRQRAVGAGHVVVVSGGTAHGIGIDAPSAASTIRQRGIAAAEGLLEAAGRIRSPFTVSGSRPAFVEPPHMQVSMLHLPPGVPIPQIGDEVDVRVRNTIFHADAVVIS
jgi:hypothetical protein